jgi:molecular chaperone DnaJ
MSHYSTLVIPQNASDEDIKRAYGKLALKYHPDKSKNTEELFKSITEAKTILLDPILRKKYDKSLIIIPKSIRQRRGTNINISLKISVTDIASETLKNIITIRQNHCPECAGTGCPSKALTPCHKCNGTGLDLVSSVMGQKKLCPLCKGYGDYPENPSCKKCGGTGLIPENINRQFKIHREFQPNLSIPGSGNFPQGGKIPGDLLITLIVEKSNTFEVDGKNIKGQLKISPAQAVLGDTIFLDIFGSAVKIILPAGTKHGDTIKKDNAGITKGGKKGDLILKTFIDIPKRISEEEKKLYTQLLKLQKVYL